MNFLRDGILPAVLEEQPLGFRNWLSAGRMAWDRALRGGG